jgi:drug/metabolite transporter (DMT)-like permease
MFALFTFFSWGTTNFLIGYGEKNQHMDATLFTAVMWITIGAFGTSLLAYLYFTNNMPAMDSKLLHPIAAIALLGIGILSFTFALSHSGASTGATAAVATSNAVFTTILALFFLKENLDLKEWIGVATIVVGIIILRF